MYNPQTHVFDDARGFIKAMRREFPTVRSSPSRYKKTPCDVCEGGALLLYSVRKGLVDPTDLMRVVNGGDEPANDEDPWLTLSPNDEGLLDVEWRFPLPDTLEVVLIGLNPRLANTPDATQMASNIIDANDAGKFKKAEQLIEQALCWPNA